MECSYIVGGKQNILTKCSGTPNYITTNRSNFFKQAFTHLKAYNFHIINPIIGFCCDTIEILTDQ